MYVGVCKGRGGKFIHFFIDISWVDGTGHQKNSGPGIYTVDQIG